MQKKKNPTKPVLKAATQYYWSLKSSAFLTSVCSPTVTLSLRLTQLSHLELEVASCFLN